MQCGLASVAGVLVVILFSNRFNTQASLAFAMILQGAGVAATGLVLGGLTVLTFNRQKAASVAEEQ